MSATDKKIFFLVCDKNYSYPDCAYLRSSIGSEEEAVNFVEKLSEKTQTNWIYRTTNKTYSSKFVFHGTWLCHLSMSKTISSINKFPFHDVRCSARIVIFIKNKKHFNQEDKYLHHKPPLPCVICIKTEHTHATAKDVVPRLATGIDEEVKKKFYDFFESGLTVIKAKKKYVAHCKLQKINHKQKSSCIPTVRQIQCLYNYWCTIWKSRSLKEISGGVVNMPVTLEEFLAALPRIKKPVLSGRCNFFQCQSSVKNMLFPMNFISMNSFETQQSLQYQNCPLLFKLKWSICGLLPPHVLLQVYEVKIDCSKCKAANTLSAVENEEGKSLVSVPEMHLKSLIKEEPLDCDELDSVKMLSQQSMFFEQKSTKLKQNASVAPIIIDKYFCESNCVDNKISLQLPSSDHDCVGIRKFRLPFVFTSVCSRDSPLKNSFSTLYTLRHGPNFEYVTQDCTSRILSLELNSLKQATLSMQTCAGNCGVEPVLLTKVPLSVSVKIEQRERTLCRSNVVSSPIVALREPIAIISNMSSKKGLENSKITTNEGILDASLSKHLHNSKDDDYEFLMSLLPAMKKLTQDEKSKVKTRVQNFVTASKRCASILNLEERSNVYRDCGVLPVWRDLKF